MVGIVVENRALVDPGRRENWRKVALQMLDFGAPQQ
jgi:hypothetical protein